MKARAYLLRAFQFVFVMHLVGLSVPAQAINTTHNGITVSWEALPLFDIMPGPSETWGNNYYYQSAQFQPEGNWLSVRITLPAEYVQNSTDWGSQITLYNPATGSTLAATDQVWPTGSPAEDLVLQALVPVNVTSNYLWAAFSISVSVGVGDVYSGFSIHFTASPSLRTSLAFNSGKSGGPDDNPWTVFDLSDGPGCSGQQGLPYYSVNTSTLNLVVQDTDYISVGVGPEIATTHTWNTDPSQQGMFGNGWTFPYESTLTTNCFGASLKKGSGQAVHYNARLCDPDPVTFPLSAESPKGVLDTLTLMSGDYWIWKERSTKYQYRYDFLSTNAYGEKTYRLTSLTDKNGNAANFTYNANDRISAITDAGARVVSFTYDVNGHCQSMTTPDNKTASYAYDGNGNLTRTVDLLGTEIAYTYDADNYLTSMRVGDKTTTFIYDEVDGWFHVASITDANGKAKTYRSPKYRQHEATDSRGNTTTYISDSAGRSLAVTNAVSAFTQWVYNANGLPSSARDANSRTTLMEYDARGNLTKLTDPLGSVTTFTFDADDNMLTRTNALGQTWSYDYDGNGNLSKMTTPLNSQAAMIYDARGRLTSMTNENNQTTFFTYDSFGNIQTVKDPVNNTTTYEYDAYGINRTKLTSADGKSTQYEYDNNRRLTKEIYADGTFRTYSYDSCSLVASTDEKGNRTELTRDNLLNVTRTTNPSGESVASEYDGNSNLTSLTDALNHNYINTYDSENRLTRIKNPAGNSLVKTYDAVSNMTALTDERGKTTSLTYDKNNRHATTVDPLGKTVTNQRDALGRIAQITNARGGRIGFAYDADGRMIQKTYNGTAVATYGYDNAGNMTSASDATGSTTTYSYNELNKVDGIQYPHATALSFVYDQVGNVTTITYPGGLVVGYSYDLRNRIQTVTWDSQSISYQYDGAGNPLGIVRPNNTASTCAFDANDRIVEIDHQRNSTSFAKMQYTRDAVGNIVRETSTLPISPLVTSMTMAAHYTDANQIDTWRNNGYTYDADGNVTQIKDIETDKVSWSAIYDQQNRLTQLTRGAATAAYTYDGAGNRTKAVVGSTVRNYHYDHLGRLMFETDGNGMIGVYYIYAGERVVAQKNSGSSYFYHFDMTGNTLALTDAAGGIVNAYAYTPFGQVAGSSGTLYNPFTYVGEFGVMSEGGNIYFMKNRYYDAVTGRFIQKDPVGFTGGQSNLYAYVGNNPVEIIDPSGTAWWEDVAVGAAAAGGYAAVLVATGTPVGWGVLAVGGAAMTIKKTYELVTTQAPKTAAALDKASQSMANLGRASRSLVRTCEMSDSGTLEEKIEIYYKQRDGQVELYNVGVEAKDAMKDAAGETLKTAIEAGKVASGLKK